MPKIKEQKDTKKTKGKPDYKIYGVRKQEEFMKLDEHVDFLLFCFPDMNRVAFEYFNENEQAHALLIYNLMKDQDFTFPDTINKNIIDKSD